MVGDLYWNPGHLLGEITTESAEDSALTINNSVDNDTAFAWTGYNVNAYMSSMFAISNVTVSTPGDWSVTSVVQPTYTGSNYMGQVLYTSGTPVAIGGQFDYGYKLVFAGATSYTFCQEVSAIPEPSTLGLVMAAGLLFGGIVVYKRRKRESAV